MLRNESGKIKPAFIGLIIVLLAVIVAGAIYKMQPTEIAVAAGDVVEVTVKASKIEDLYGYQFELGFDEAALEFAGGLKSEIEDIETIFSKPFDGYRLVGATMIGKHSGISGKNQKMCKMKFTALKDCTISNDTFALSGVNVVTPELEYNTDLDGWSYKFALAKEAD